MSLAAAAAPKPWEITTKERAIFSLIVMLGAFMAVLDTTIVDVIVPKLTGPLASDMYGVQWIITSYMLAAAIALLLVEYLIKRFGSKSVFLIGVVLFTIGSLACGVAQDLPQMILFRVIQGVGEAFIMVTSHIMIFSYFPPHLKGLAMGIFGLGVSFAPAIGPTLGGYLTEYFGWRMVFFINVPIGIVLILAGMIYLPRDRELSQPVFNYLSFFLISIATVSLLIMLSKGQQMGWFDSEWIGILLFVAVVGYLLFALSEMWMRVPLIDFSLFRNSDFFNGIMVYFFIMGFSMYQYFYLIPVYYEHIKRLPTLEAGIAVFGFAVFIGFFAPIAGILSDKIGAKRTLLIATVVYLYTAVWVLPTLNYYTPLSQAIILTIPFGIGMGLFFAPITVLLMESVPEEKGELAIVLMDYMRFVGGSFGTAIATNNMELFKNQNFQAMSELQNWDFVQNYLEQLAGWLGGALESAKLMFGNYEMFMAYNYGFYNTFMNGGYWGLIGVVFVLALILTGRKDHIKETHA